MWNNESLKSIATSSSQICHTRLFGAPVTFQRPMYRVLCPIAAAYLYDIIIHSNTWAEHVQRLMTPPEEVCCWIKGGKYLVNTCYACSWRKQQPSHPVEEGCTHLTFPSPLLCRRTSSDRGLVRGVDRPVVYMSWLNREQIQYSGEEVPPPHEGCQHSDHLVVSGSAAL